MIDFVWINRNKLEFELALATGFKPFQAWFIFVADVRKDSKGSTKGNIASNEENLLERWGSGDE
jgi:hypothetical protein